MRIAKRGERPYRSEDWWTFDSCVIVGLTTKGAKNWGCKFLVRMIGISQYDVREFHWIYNKENFGADSPFNAENK